VAAPSDASHASNVTVQVAAAFMPNAKIKPVQRLKIPLWVKTAEVLRTPLKNCENNSLQGPKSGSSIPLNLLGGYRWPDAPKLDSKTIGRILYVEVAALVGAVT
jgi:hypothetical protein